MYVCIYIYMCIYHTLRYGWAVDNGTMHAHDGR